MDKLVPLIFTVLTSLALHAQSNSELIQVNFLKSHGVSGFFLEGSDLNRMMRERDPFTPLNFPALVITSLDGPANSKILTLDSKKYQLANGHYDENKSTQDKKKQLKKAEILKSQFLILHDESYRI